MGPAQTAVEYMTKFPINKGLKIAQTFLSYQYAIVKRDTPSPHFQLRANGLFCPIGYKPNLPLKGNETVSPPYIVG